MATRAALTSGRLVLALFVAILLAAPSWAAEIHKLVQNGQVGALETLLKGHSDGSIVNDTIGAGVTPLHIAAARNDKAAAEILIAHGATIDIKTSTGFTPLHWAANRDSVYVAEVLLKHGATINATTPDGITPLHWAASKNASGLVRLLLLAGADPAMKTKKGFTPLHWAIMKEASAAAELLAYQMSSDSSEPELESTSGAIDEPSEEAAMPAGVTLPPPERASEKQQAMAALDQPLPPSSLESATAAAIPEDDAVESPDPSAMSLVAPSVLAPQDGKDCSLWISPSDALSFKWNPSLKSWVGKYEVTNRQYRRFNPGHSSLFFESFAIDGEDQPAVRVSWHDANRYCQWLMTNEVVQFPAGFVVRLPSEAEWMTIASGGSARTYAWGDTLPPAWGNLPDETARAQLPDWQGFDHYTDGSVVACDVASSGVNDMGIYGLAGNAWEWCSDEFNGGKYRVRKGGSWDFDAPTAFRIDFRGFDRPEVRDVTIGFRLILSRTN